MNAPGKHAALGAIDSATIELAEQLDKLARLTAHAQDHLVAGRPLGELPAAIRRQAIVAERAGLVRAANWHAAYAVGASLPELTAAGRLDPPEPAVPDRLPVDVTRCRAAGRHLYEDGIDHGLDYCAPDLAAAARAQDRRADAAAQLARENAAVDADAARLAALRAAGKR